MGVACTWLPGDPRDLLTADDKADLAADLARIADLRRKAASEDGPMRSRFEPTPPPPIQRRRARIVQAVPPPPAPEQAVTLLKCRFCWQRFTFQSLLTEHEARHRRMQGQA